MRNRCSASWKSAALCHLSLGSRASALRTIFSSDLGIFGLMSVGFGMSMASLTTRSAFEELRIVNPTLYKKMHIVAEGEESLLLLLAVPENFVKASSEIVNGIKNMPLTPEGRNKMKMLGLDGWEEPAASDRLKLEAK